MLRIETYSRTAILTTRALLLPPHSAVKSWPYTFHHRGSVQGHPADFDNTRLIAVASPACA